MRQLNRRDYLLQMGAGAAGLVAASELPLLGQRRRPNRTQTQSGGRRTVQSPFLKWPTTDTKPKADAFVTVIYAGLAGLAYNDRQPDNEFVDVVFHPGNGGHKLEIQVYTDPPLDPDQCNPPEIIPSKKSDRLRFEVSGQTGELQTFFKWILNSLTGTILVRIPGQIVKSGAMALAQSPNHPWIGSVQGAVATW